MSSVYFDIDLAEFWEPSEYALQNYIGAPLTDGVVAAVERALGYKLPASYVALMRFQNGGIPWRTRHRTREPTSWAVGHIAITGIYAIGREPSCSLCGEAGSEFSIREWGYPPIGVYFADCPSAGHDMLCLDYRACGPTGEPRVVHIDQERDYAIVEVAETFDAFVRGLEHAQGSAPSAAWP